MTTLIQATNSDGVVGRCDSKCYNAKHDKCECICGGLNHGAGYKKALENMDRVVDENLKKGLKVKKHQEQMELFKGYYPGNLWLKESTK